METGNQTSLLTAHLIIKDDVSKNNVCTNHPGKMRALNLFQIAT